MKQKENIGTITLGEIAFLSDPCYGTISKWNCTMEMIPGDYFVFITRTMTQTIQGRISSLYVVHKDFYKNFKKRPSDDHERLRCAVDSGTCGIFNAEYFEQFHDKDGVDDNWYEENVIKMDEFKITDGKGAISSTGLGDGLYPVYAEYKNGKAFALRIKYL
jgi:hypothetical protein